MVRNKNYVVRKLANVVYALPVGQGREDQMPVMQLGRLEWDIIERVNEDEAVKKVFEDLVRKYQLVEEELEPFWDDYCHAVTQLEACHILENVRWMKNDRRNRDKMPGR